MIHTQDADFLLDQLERLGRTLGITVRYELFGDEEDAAPTRSGLCRVKDNSIFLVDKRLCATRRCGVLAQELRRFDLREFYVSPAVRRLLEDSDAD